MGNKREMVAIAVVIAKASIVAAWLHTTALAVVLQDERSIEDEAS